MPPSKWERWFIWWCVAAMLIVLHNLYLAHNAYGQVVVRFKADLPTAGATTCDSAGKPEIWIKAGQDGVTVNTILKHEMTHVRQMNSYPSGCMALRTRYGTDWKFRLAMELEAYATNRPALPPEEKEAYIDSFVLFLWGNYIRGSGLASYSQVKDFVLNGGIHEPP